MSSNATSAYGKGSNSVQMRQYNERVVLDAIRRLGQASKADVARYANLTPPAVAAIFEALEAAGYIALKGKRFGKKGQPSSLYSLDPEGGGGVMPNRSTHAFQGVARTDGKRDDRPACDMVGGVGPHG